jgi:hypothetical protein
MGYACPVCESAQADAAHLANHLAFTAMLGDDEHEAWLDERVPDWADRSPATLGPDVAQYAPERELEGAAAESGNGEQSERHHGSGHSHGSGTEAGGAPRFESELARQGGYGRDAGTADGEVDRVLAEARDLTEQMAGTDPLGTDGDVDGDGDRDTAEAECGRGDGDKRGNGNENENEDGGEAAPDGDGDEDGGGNGERDESGASEAETE